MIEASPPPGTRNSRTLSCTFTTNPSFVRHRGNHTIVRASARSFRSTTRTGDPTSTETHTSPGITGSPAARCRTSSRSGPGAAAQPAIATDASRIEIRFMEEFNVPHSLQLNIFFARARCDA